MRCDHHPIVFPTCYSLLTLTLLFAGSRSTVPLLDSSFSLLPLHFAVDPAMDAVSGGKVTSTAQSYNRQMSVSEQVELLAKYMDLDRVSVATVTGTSQGGGSSAMPDDGGGMRPRTGTWSGCDHESTETGKQTDRKKVNNYDC